MMVKQLKLLKCQLLSSIIASFYSAAVGILNLRTCEQYLVNNPTISKSEQLIHFIRPLEGAQTCYISILISEPSL